MKSFVMFLLTILTLLNVTSAYAADEVLEPAASDRVDMTGLWMRSNRSLAGNLDENFEQLSRQEYLNERGLEAVEVVRPAFDPSAMCLPSMPRHLGAPYPFEIIQNEERFVQLFEYESIFRIIYTDGRDHPDSTEDQRYMGHAVGYWEDGTLIVDTQNFNGKAWLSLDGIPLSDKAHLTEWYSLIDDGQTLQIVLQLEDEEYFSRPIWKKYLYNLRNEFEILEYLCAEGNRDNVFMQQEGLPGSFQIDDVLPE